MDVVNKQYWALFSVLFFSCNADASDWFFDGGISVAGFERENSGRTFDSEIRSSLQFGVHKAISPDFRFGSKLEFLAGDSENPHVLYLRMGDLDWRFAERWALNLSAGAVRFYREQPAYGYGYSAGVKYSLTDNVYVSADVTLAASDISTGVPADEGLGNKDDLKWMTVGVFFVF